VACGTIQAIFGVSGHTTTLRRETYYSLLPILGPVLPVTRFRLIYRAKLSPRQHEKIHKFMKMVQQVTIFWSAMEDRERESWTDQLARLIRENAGNESILQ